MSSNLKQELKSINDLLKKNVDAHSGYFHSETIGLSITIRQLNLLQDSISGWIYEIEQESR